MAVGTGVGLSINSDFLKRLTEADKLIAKMHNTSSKLKTSTIHAFQTMTQQGVVPFVESLRQQKRMLEEIGKVNNTSGSKIFARIQRDAAKTVDEINKVVIALEKTKAYKGELSGKTAISFANSVLGRGGEIKSIENMQLAISQLTAQQNRQNLGTKKGQRNFQKLGEKIKEVEKELARFKKTQDATNNSAMGLGRTFALVYSVHLLSRFVSKMTSVYGTMEQQHKAMQIILQNKEDANRIWEQTMELAIRSPFQINQLVQYTRQLAAYRVESHKLHDTTKMLADVSAGLGVDMQRLILAFGQVKAASFLRGTELRQFTEAGIPMLEELAKHFTELEGRVYSVDEVFAMISKRQVEFQDVEQVFKNMTSEGGVFFNMQEEMAETVKGKVSNLKDSITLMFNEIGQSNEGMIYGTIAVLKKLVDNWRYVGVAIKTVIMTLAAYQIAATISAFKTGAVTSALAGEEVQVNALTRAYIALANAKKSLKLGTGAWGMLAVGVVAATTAVMGFVKARRREKEATEAAAQRAEELEQELKIIGETYTTLAKQIEQYSETFSEAIDEDDLKEQKLQLMNLIDVANEEYHMKIMVDVEGLSAEEIQDKYNEIEKQVQDAQIFSELFENEFENLNVNGIINNLDGLLKYYKENYKTLDWETFEGENALEKVIEAQIAELEKSLSYAEDRLNRLIATAGPRGGGSSHLRREISKAKEDIEYQQRQIETVRKRLEPLRSALKQISDEVSAQGYDAQQVVNAALNRLIDREKFDPLLSELLVDFTEEAYGLEGLKVDGSDRVLEQWESGFNKLLEGMAVDLKDIVPNKWLQELQDLKLNENEMAGKFVKAITPNRVKTREEMVKLMKEIMDEAEEVMKSYAVEGQGVFSWLDNFLAQKRYEQAKKLWQYLGGYEKDSGGGGKDKVLEKLKERISFIKEANREYEKLIENMTKEEAKQEVINAMKETARRLDLDINSMDFTDEGTETSLLELKTFPEYVNSKKMEEYFLEIQKAADNYTIQLKVDTYIAKREELDTQVEELFDRQELTKEMEELGLDSEAAKLLFGIDSLSLDELKAEVLSLEDAYKATGEKGEEAYQKHVEKITSMEVKEQRERMQEYIKASRESLGEAAKIRMEQLQKIADYEKTFEVKDGDSEELKAIKIEEKARAIARATQEANEALAKLEWDEFRKSETFVSLFDDLEHASNEMLQKVVEDLKGFKDEWSDLPVSEMKEVVDLMNKAQRALESEDSPWKEAERLRGVIDADGRTRAKAEEESYDAEKKILDLNKEIEAIDLITQKRNEQGGQEKADAELRNILAEDYYYLLEKDNKALGDQRRDLKGQIVDQAKIVSSAQNHLDNQDALRRSYEEQAEALGEMEKMASDLYNAFSELYEAIGGDDDDFVAVFAEMGMNMASTVLQTFALKAQLDAASESATEFGLAMNAAMGVVGWIVMGVQLLTQAISAIAKIRDNTLLKKIEEQAREVDNLREKYEDIEEKMDEAFSTVQISRYNAELRKTTEEMIRAQKAAIAAQKQRKKANKEGSENWEELREMERELAEMEKELEESLKESFSTISDGILDSVYDAAKEFTDAWYEAFAETGDGLSGLEDNFNDMLLNLAKNQAAMQITGAFADQWKKDLEKYINEDDTELTKEEARKWAEEVRETFPELNAALEGYLGAFADLMNPEAGGLSALQKGIQGLSESTGQVIESLLNSLRFYVADSNSELKSQTKYMRDMYNMLSSMTANHSQGGRGIKVVM